MPAISVEVPEDIRPDLDELARHAGMTPSEYMLDLVLEEISDRQLLQVAEERYREHLASGAQGIPLEKVMRDLGLDD